MRGWVGVVGVLVLTAAAMGQSCPARLDLGLKTRSYTGVYRNFAYGFQTRVPPGLAGLDSDDPEHQRGFAVTLPEGGGTIWVYADTNSAHASLRQAAEMDFWELRKRAERVETPVYAEERIGGRRAQRVTAHFACKGNAEPYGMRSVEAMDRGRRFVYNLAWEGPVTGEASAARTMRAMEGAWRFVPAR